MHRPVIYPDEQALVFVVRKDGEPGLYLAPGVTKGDAITLLEAVTARLRGELGRGALQHDSGHPAGG